MLNKNIKNLISIVAFAVFLIIGFNIFIRRYEIKVKSQAIADKYILNNTEEKSEINSDGLKEISEDSTYYNDINENNTTTDDINIDFAQNIDNSYNDLGLLDVSKYLEEPKIVEENEKLFSEYEKFINDLRNYKNSKYYKLNTDYVNEMYNRICFIGDSNVLKIQRLKYINDKNIFPFGALMLKDIIKKADDKSAIDVSDFDYAVIWIGYNIKYIENSEHFISEYNALIEKLKNQNPKIKVYVCSLLPATKEKIDEDIANGAIHNFYKGVEYDAKLSEYFNENYINTKVFIKDNTDYTSDGFHMQTTFYDRMIPYVGFYINFMEIKGKHNGI